MKLSSTRNSVLAKISTLITDEELSEWTGYKRFSDLIRWLQKNGIAYTVGHSSEKRICTTLNAINIALFGGEHQEEIDFLDE